MENQMGKRTKHELETRGLINGICIRWTSHQVIVTIRGNKDYTRVLFLFYYTIITGWGVLLRYAGRYKYPLG